MLDEIIGKPTVELPVKASTSARRSKRIEDWTEGIPPRLESRGDMEASAHAAWILFQSSHYGVFDCQVTADSLVTRCAILFEDTI